MAKEEIKTFLTKLKKFEEEMPELTQYIQQEYLEDDHAIVYVDASQLDLFDSLSYGKQLDLNEDFYSFIERKVYPVPVKYPVVIRFCRRNFTSEEQSLIKKLIVERYSVELRDKILDLKINKIKVTALTVIGVLLLGIYFSLELANLGNIFMEFLSIAGTFALWEAVDFYLLERKDLKTQKYNTGQLAMLDVEFES